MIVAMKVPKMTHHFFDALTPVRLEAKSVSKNFDKSAR